MVLNNPLFVARKSRSGYQIEQSLRFDGSSYLTMTNSSAPTGQYKGSFSLWVKLDKRKVDTDNYFLQNSVPGGPPYSNGALYYETNSGTGWNFVISNNSNPSTRTPTNGARDVAAWYHVFFVFDHTQSTSAAGMKIYINGQQRNGASFGGETAGGWSDAQNQPLSFLINGRTINMGRSNAGNAHFAGYMAEFHCVDGQTLLPSDFAEENNDGVWVPKKYTGTYGNNGWYMKFDPSATNGIGHDHSGSGNHWTPSGFSTSGTGTDVMSDTPTNNFATLNSIYQPYDMSFSDGNLFFQPTTSNWRSAQSTIPVTGSGKYYCEMKLSSINEARMCLTSIQSPDLYNYGVPSYSSNNGLIVDDDLNAVTYGSSWTSGDVIAMAIDMDNGSVAFYKNGSLQGTVTGLDTSLLWRPGVIGYTSSSNGYFNFGQRAWEQTPPTGFDNAICTANLPAPTIKDGSKYFGAVTYSGNTSTNSITSLNFSPDFVWIKSRSHASSHAVYDILRGTNRELRPDVTDSEYGPFSDSFNSFDSNGFTLGTDTGNGDVNLSGRTYVAWCWDAGSSTSSNTDGTITSSVRANPSAGISIVSYTGNGSTSATVGHGLNAIPAVVIAKSRGTTEAWMVKHENLASNNILELAVNNATADGTTFSVGTLGNLTSSSTFNFVTGTSSVDSVNKSGDNVIAYCFSEIPGFSAFGEYAGNANYSDGAFVYTGFKVAWLMLKVKSAAGNWQIYDNTRRPYNDNKPVLYPDLSQGEDTLSNSLDFLSNGFKVYGYGNDSQTFVYFAFAEHPFGGDGVSPATAYSR